MKLRHLLLGIFASVALCTVGLAQGASGNAPGRGVALVKAAKTADEAWSIVTNFVATRGPEAKLDPSSPDALSPADLYAQASEAASAFYTGFPTHARVNDGRKLETIYAFHAARAGAAGYKDKAAGLAAAFRADKRFSERDRYEVAVLVDGAALAEKLAGKRFLDDGVKYEQFADALYSEFSDITEIYELYVSIARTTDVTTATRVARKVLAYGKVPDWARPPLQAVIDRSSLIGKPAKLTLTTMGGDKIDLSAPHPKPTVVFLWSVADGLTQSLEMLDHFRSGTPIDARWFYVGLGGEQPVSDRPMAGSPFAASHCFVQPMFGNPITNYLRVNQAPYLFVLNRAGEVVGYGFPENLPALLEAAAR